MGSVLGVSSFPFCAVLAPAAGDNLAVLQQVIKKKKKKIIRCDLKRNVEVMNFTLFPSFMKLEGPVAPADLVEILQRTIVEQGPAFGRKEMLK